MLPPPPSSRQSSYAYNLPRTHSHRHSRKPSVRSVAESALGLDGDDDEEALRMEMEMAEEVGGMGNEGGLEETLEKLGFGAYHWRLLALCGFGWMSDNSALQCVAVILPRVQVHFDLSSKVVGLLSASTMAGMMVGAVGWGVISDLLGRALPFNSTLFLTGVFGIGASFSPTFGILCCWMFLLGSAVGGSMPTDGTLFLENLPHSKQYLLTLLSVFFSLGAVLSSVVSLIFLPGASCQTYDGCDIDGKANNGWRRVMLVLGLFNLSCSFARWFLFKLQESPRYLVSNGRSQEAVVALQAIANYNNHSIDINHADVASGECSAAEPSTRRGSGTGLDLEQGGGRSPQRSAGLGSPLNGGARGGGGGGSGEGSPDSKWSYGGVGIGPPRTPHAHPIRSGSAFFATPSSPDGIGGEENHFDRSFASGQVDEEPEDAPLMDGEEGDAHGDQRKSRRTAAGGLGAEGDGWRDKPAQWWESWVEQMGKLFVPQWRKTVILMWIIWGSMSFGYTMFNVWLPSVLESRAKGEGDEAIKEALGDYVLYSLAGCPGSIVGAWMIQTKLGRRKSLAICTLATGLSTFAFIRVEEKWAVVVSSMVISAAATAMYAVLYGMTPETFGTAIRGTACGTSAALSRLTGVAAPVSAGFLLTISPSLPVFTSAAIFCMTAVCSLLLPFERVAGAKGGGGLMH
ncbi:hypothetical protein IAT38_005997 [Cryptococcus sp. DSM 104549]